MTIPFKPSLLAMASVLALSACISGGGDAPAVKSSETPSNKVAPPPTDTGNPATGTDTASPATGADTASSSAGGDGGDSKTEIPPKDTQGENAPAGTDGGVQNDALQHNDNASADGTSDTQPENNRDMPVSAAGGADVGNQDTDAPKNAESQDGTEENAVSEDAGMQASPPSEKNEHPEPAMNPEEKKPQAEAEDSKDAGQDGMQADEASGRQDAEEELQGDDPTAHPPQDQPPQNAADNQPKTGVFGEKYFDGTGEITTLMIDGEAIDLTKADELVSSRNHPGLMSDFNKVMVSQNQYKHLIYGAAKLKDGSYTLFVQGKPTEQLPVGNATYNGKVLHFRKAYENNWFNDSAYQAAGTFTANVDFSQRTVTGKIDTKDLSGMGMQEFTASIDGSGFQGKWKSDNDQGDISGKFYGQDGAEMAGRYDYKNQDNRKDGFGVFAGKKEADAR
uniref:Putative lipoprotein n=1 Tax=Neisseria meningitidis TaxID=487 RepID=B8ZHG3_NEIME|nr:putative lipoprotein [Neisseria meningitidis]